MSQRSSALLLPLLPLPQTQAQRLSNQRLRWRDAAAPFHLPPPPPPPPPTLPPTLLLPHPLHLCLLPSTNNRVHSAIIDLHRCDRSSTPPTSSSSRVAGPLPPHPSPAGARWHWPQQRRDSHPIEHPVGQKLA